MELVIGKPKRRVTSTAFCGRLCSSSAAVCCGCAAPDVEAEEGSALTLRAQLGVAFKLTSTVVHRNRTNVAFLPTRHLAIRKRFFITLTGDPPTSTWIQPSYRSG